MGGLDVLDGGRGGRRRFRGRDRRVRPEAREVAETARGDRVPGGCLSTSGLRAPTRGTLAAFVVVGGGRIVKNRVSLVVLVLVALAAVAFLLKDSLFSSSGEGSNDAA